MTKELATIFLKDAYLDEFSLRREPGMCGLNLNMITHNSIVATNFPTKNISLADIEIKISSSTEPSSYSYEESWVESDDSRISNISKVIVNNPATIIIDKQGNKSVVKYQKDIHSKIRYNVACGFFLCLLKYLLSDKLYHDTLVRLFSGPTNIENTIYSIIVSHIGEKEASKICAKFYDEFYNKIFKYPQKFYTL